jgi:L-aspartate oxidase
VNSFPSRLHVPVLVLGSGIAGLSTAYRLARRGVKVLVLTKAANPAECNTAWAQGGIIYFGKGDSQASLAKDILRAGAGLCLPEAVALLARRGPEVVKSVLLRDVGVAFSRTRRGDLDFTREGAHSIARIVHSEDATGKAIETAMLARLGAERNVTVWTEATAIDLITARHHSRDVAQRYALQDPCLGAYVLDRDEKVHTVLSDFTVLATGGVGRLFLHTTNTKHAIGDGLAMAERAGAATMNLEYVQFHPTALYHEDAEGFLISESLRGEGAVLVNRAEPCVFLDLARHFKSHDGLGIRERFPMIAARCAELGIDIEREPIPVVPAAHYHCGGVLVDLDGRTTIRRLYAVGEASCTGVHGANRLASTSLLEGLVWGDAAATAIAGRLKREGHQPSNVFRAIPDWMSPGDAANEDPALLQQDWATIRNTMWNYVGIVRTTARLARAVADLRDLEKRILRFYEVTKISKEIVDLTHGVRAAHAIATAAFKNPVSKGCHYRKN